MLDILFTASIAILFVLALFTVLFYYYYKRKFLKQLRSGSDYSTAPDTVDKEIQFEYSSPDDADLKQLRERYKLGTVTGNGSETDRMINLMKWTHEKATRTPYPSVPEEINSLYLLKAVETEQKAINCWMYSIILNDVYLSMGFKSRIVHLNSPKKAPRESHFVNAVYSDSLGKWLYMDADFGAYFKDENETLLGLEEIRHKLVNNGKLVVNPDSGPRVRKFSTLVRILGRKAYKTYLSKNIYRLRCQIDSGFGREAARSGQVYVELIPAGYREENLEKVVVTERKNTIIFTRNPELFWRRP
ncbi:MAG: hypothetical protein ACFFD4_38650 [Candidatus Odinarchaeota archaeon]